MIVRWTLLIFDVWVDDLLIDQVYVQRIKTNENGVHKYQVKRPFEFEHLKINHQYEEGYIPLAIKVFTKLQEAGYKREKDETY